MKGEYLSNIIDVGELKEGVLNLIVAPCGSGKTYFAKNELRELNKYYRDELVQPPMLYLIDTAIGKEQLLHSKEARPEINFWTEKPYWVLPDITVMTYAGYATLHEKAPKYDTWHNIKSVIICDELHNAVNWSKWTNRDNIHKKAIELISYNIMMSQSIVVCITATPDSVREYFSFCEINEVSLSGEPRHYENGEEIFYSNLTLLLKGIKKGKRGIVYLEKISEIIKYKKILDERGFKTATLWSMNNPEYPLSEKQVKDREQIINNRELQSNIDVLFVNKACETSISIGDEEHTKNPLDFMIVHSCKKDTQIQVRGRYRNDLPTLYLYESGKKEKIVLDESWLNVPLYKKDKDRLCEILQFRVNGRLQKWTSIKRLLIENDYEIVEDKHEQQRYSIIKKRQN